MAKIETGLVLQSTETTEPENTFTGFGRVLLTAWVPADDETPTVEGSWPQTTTPSNATVKLQEREPLSPESELWLDKEDVEFTSSGDRIAYLAKNREYRMVSDVAGVKVALEKVDDRIIDGSVRR